MCAEVGAKSLMYLTSSSEATLVLHYFGKMGVGELLGRDEGTQHAVNELVSADRIYSVQKFANKSGQYRYRYFRSKVLYVEALTLTSV